MSAKFAMPDLSDLKSVLRHTVVPLISGGLIAGWEAYQTGQVGPKEISGAAIIAVLSGLVRLVSRWATPTTGK